ncbi:uncharacterized protein Dwil_GK16926 [Drosophila willistoni]|uniref:RRM domain-containing protein n=1 Tax=Drosophila willistoni TaxID=7260 RepID=B4NPZ7_DROWI|nr:RNA-binding protein 4F [Drosophila willistoni]EDW86222.1 uncharacterized protein Dwil_GK16926 [Drosophila willistoni]
MDCDQSEEEVQLKIAAAGESAPIPADADDNQTIEISSDSSNGPSDSDSDSDDDVGIIDDDTDEDGESPEEQDFEDTFEFLMTKPDKEFRHLVQLSEVAFKLNDLEKIDLMVVEFEKLAVIPGNIWIKYLKAWLVVTQTDEERRQFEDKCAKSLRSSYSIPLAEFIVDELVKLQKIENPLLWANLLADYGLERPDFIQKLHSLIKAANLTEEESTKINEQMQKHCPTWASPPEQVEIIINLIKSFIKHIEAFKPQYNNWNWAKVHSPFVEKADELPLNDGIQDGLCKLIFERCVAKFPTVDAVWMDYIHFVENENTDGEAGSKNPSEQVSTKKTARCSWGYLKASPLDLARRAVKCHPSIRTNHKFLNLMERSGYTPAQVESELKLLLARIQPEMNMTVELHLDYLAYLLRAKNVGEEEQANQVRAAFQSSWDILSDLYGDQADTSYEMLQLWAHVEYCLMASPAKAVEIWRQIMGYPGSSYRGQLWMSYAQMECEYNGVQSALVVLREAMGQPAMEDAHLVQELYRRYERIHGTYETIAECQSQKAPEPEWHTSRRRPRAEIYPAHRPKQQQQPRQPQVNPSKKPKKTPPEATPTPTAAPARSPVAAEAKQPKPQFGSNFKYSTNMETNKIFVKNLPSDCTKEQLTGIFKPFGTIKDVRLVFKFNKQFKGIAYIEYELPSEAQKAVTQRDGFSIGGQKINVAISNPPPKPPLNNPPALQSAPKRRVATSLIPTTLVRQEAKRRKQLDVEPEKSVPADCPPANGDSDQSRNGNNVSSAIESTSADAAVAPPATAPKSNDDFRKLFSI